MGNVSNCQCFSETLVIMTPQGRVTNDAKSYKGHCYGTGRQVVRLFSLISLHAFQVLFNVQIYVIHNMTLRQTIKTEQLIKGRQR